MGSVRPAAGHGSRGPWDRRLPAVPSTATAAARQPGPPWLSGNPSGDLPPSPGSPPTPVSCLSDRLLLALHSRQEGTWSSGSGEGRPSWASPDSRPGWGCSAPSRCPLLTAGVAGPPRGGGQTPVWSCVPWPTCHCRLSGPLPSSVLGAVQVWRAWSHQLPPASSALHGPLASFFRLALSPVPPLHKGTPRLGGVRDSPRAQCRGRRAHTGSQTDPGLVLLASPRGQEGRPGTRAPGHGGAAPGAEASPADSDLRPGACAPVSSLLPSSLTVPTVPRTPGWAMGPTQQPSGWTRESERRRLVPQGLPGFPWPAPPLPGARTRRWPAHRSRRFLPPGPSWPATQGQPLLCGPSWRPSRRGVETGGGWHRPGLRMPLRAAGPTSVSPSVRRG